jgi:tryptophan synthase beta chain
MFEAIFPMNLILQEMSPENRIEIPEEVRKIYALWRPTPLFRAIRFEKALDTPAHIYYKFEGASPAGSHKPNTAVPQVYYNKQAGTKHIATETGAGQWGSSLALACQLFGLDCRVYMVRVSYNQKPYRKFMMQTYGAKVFASPAKRPSTGGNSSRKTPTAPDRSASHLGSHRGHRHAPRTKYSLGSVLNHVCMHQTVIGLEALKQMHQAGEAADVVIGCAGGGSNFAGIAFPFVEQNLKHGTKTRIVAVEPASCPSLTKGEYRYDFGDTAGMTPLMKMYTLGADFMPPSIHAGGLRYHGMAPTVSHLMHLGLIEAASQPQENIFKAAMTFAHSEGLIPAPESSHAIAQVIEEAQAAKKEGKKRVIVFNLSGHGMLDLASYDSYLEGKL